MIKFVIAFDEIDEKLGTYFLGCKDDLISTITTSQVINSIHELPARLCTKAYMEIALNELADESFVLVAYMHGNEDQLVANNRIFLRAGEDNSFLNSSFVYTISCSGGSTIGLDLMANGCRTLIGFDQTVQVLLGVYRDVSMKCHNSGISAFLLQDITAYEAYEQMRAIYTQEIRKMQGFMDVLSAGVLINAREALVFHGDEGLKKEDISNLV